MDGTVIFAAGIDPGKTDERSAKRRYLRLDERAAPAAKSAAMSIPLRARSIEAESRKVNGQDAERLDRDAEH
jgi:hypothetical protein